MTDNKAKNFLTEPQVCVLATHGPHDDTHAMPMWYLYENDEILFMTGRHSQKTKNVERTGKATVVVDGREPPYYAVMVKGDADILPKLGRERRRATVSRYLSGERLEKYLSGLDNVDMITIRVRPTRLIEFYADPGGG